jgi:flagellar motility protein MotE (MotC chaperone)
MILLARQFRLIPVVLLAVTSLLVLKVLALTMEGGYTLGSPRSAQAQGASAPASAPATRLADPDLQGPKGGEPAAKPDKPVKSWAQDMLGFPDHTGSVDAPKPSVPAAEAHAKQQQGDGAAKPATPGTPVSLDNARPQLSSGERAVLESLNKRRLELEARARELEVRDGLLKAAEQRLEAKIQEVKEQEAKVKTAAGQRGEAEAVQFKSLVTMYENMKAKDAARIFDRLEMRILVDVVTQMNPRKVSDVLAQMQPEAAEKLTVELANRAGGGRGPGGELPKIEGRPGG